MRTIILLISTPRILLRLRYFKRSMDFRVGYDLGIDRMVMKIKDLIESLSKIPNQDARVWVQLTKHCLLVEGINNRWCLMEGKAYEEGDDDIVIRCEGVSLD